MRDLKIRLRGGAGFWRVSEHPESDPVMAPGKPSGRAIDPFGQKGGRQGRNMVVKWGVVV